MTSMRKRLLSSAMALAMIVTMFPLAVLGAGGTGNSEIQIEKNDSSATLYYPPAGAASTD